MRTLGRATAYVVVGLINAAIILVTVWFILNLLLICVSQAAQFFPFPGPGRAQFFSEWQQGVGFNFRATQGFVTDNLGQLAGLGYADGYPQTRTPVDYSDSVTFGRGSGSTSSTNLDAGVDPRFAGRNWRANSLPIVGYWQVDLPAAGQYEIRLAVGDTSQGNSCIRFEIRDTNGTTVLASCDPGTTQPIDQYFDATCVLRTEANWAATNAAQTVTISAGSPPKVWIFGGGGSCATDITSLAHLHIKQLISTAMTTTDCDQYAPFVWSLANLSLSPFETLASDTQLGDGCNIFTAQHPVRVP